MTNLFAELIIYFSLIKRVKGHDFWITCLVLGMGLFNNANERVENVEQGPLVLWSDGLIPVCMKINEKRNQTYLD